MRKYYNIILKLTLALAVIIGFRAYEVNALPYYDLKFEEISREIVMGEYEIISEDLSLKKENKMTMDIKKSYEPKVSVQINKDEEDAISQVLGTKWKETLYIDKKESISIKRNKEMYLQVRPVYKQIRGTIVQDYHSWNKKKELTILIPIDLEYTLNTK